MSVQTPGEAAYEAYADERAKTDYRPVDWQELGAVRQAAWEAAAQAAYKHQIDERLQAIEGLTVRPPQCVIGGRVIDLPTLDEIIAAVKARK